ncbi:MAG TPA: CoA-binding protein [Firmicutes bacterium]|nr:CoA-binding protein [Bacillota bacterium]
MPEKSQSHINKDEVTVAIIGASDKPERYSHKAFLLLREKGYLIFPVHPTLAEIAGVKVYNNLADLPPGIDTVTVYVSPQISGSLGEELRRLKPRRIIFNPGAENPALYDQLRAAGIEVIEACTLVLLNTGRF